MYQINNDKFGLFVQQIRKQKGMTQNELAQQLYVSDKTISKWERGLSYPNVSLWIPLAEVLEVSVSELLKGERGAPMKEQEEVKESIEKEVSHKRTRWIVLCCLGVIICSLECLYLFMVQRMNIEEMKEIGIVCCLSLGFAGWFSFFIKDHLPSYYDGNHISFYAQGVVRLHLPGLSFHNGNWYAICFVSKIWLLFIAIMYPLLCILIRYWFGSGDWDMMKNGLMFILMGGMVISIYIVGKKND